MSTHTCSDLVLLDAYVDGELTPAEAEAYERHAAGCEICDTEMELARRVSEALAEPAEAAPPEVVASALVRIADGPAGRRARDRRPAPPGRVVRIRLAALALAASAVIAALAVVPQLRQRRPPAAEPSQAEVARARSDVERALGLVGEATRDAGLFLRDDVLAPHVAEPAAESILEALGLSN